jgi:hypothetical protein
VEAVSAHASDCGCGCQSKGAPGVDSSPFVYAIGRIEPRPRSLAVEKELAQVAARGSPEHDAERGFRVLLTQRECRYLVRNLQWVFRADGADRYTLAPADPADFELLIDSVREPAGGDEIDVVIGVNAPTTDAGTATPPVVVFEQIYSFDRASLVASLGTSIEASVIDAVLALTGNAGTGPGHRAVNYLAVRHAGFYRLVGDQEAAGRVLAGVETVTVDADLDRDLVDVIIAFSPEEGGRVERFAARVDVTEAFPFLVTDFARHIDVSLH